MLEPATMRPNWYPDGPYRDSPCIHCGLMLEHNGSTSGTTWVPTLMKRLDPHGRPAVWWTCHSNDLHARGAARFPGHYGQHEPFQAIPTKENACPTTSPTASSPAPR